MGVADGDGGSVGELRRELAHERRALAAAIDDLERSVAIGPRLREHRWLVAGGALALGLVVAAGLAAAVRPMLRLRRRDRVLLAIDDVAVVRRRR